VSDSFEQVPESEEAEDTSDDENAPDRDSDLDTKLRGDDETNSNYDSDDFRQPPELSSLIFLDTQHCQAPTQVKSSDGTKISCACGKLGSKCGHHKDSKGYQCNPGHYVAMSNVARGYKGHP
jgi:hypothetical protein